MNKSGLFKRGVFIVLAVAVMAILMACLNFLISLFGVGISMPPNVCDLKAGFEFYPGSDDMLVGSRDLCLLRLGSKKASAQICNEIREYFMQLECIREVALQKKDPELCREFRSREESAGIDLERLECQRDIEREVFPYTTQAVKVAETDLDAAMEICNRYKIGWNRKQCYKDVSDSLYNSGSPQKMIDLCLGNPQPNEWIACLYGEIFDVLTGTDRLFDQFKLQVVSSPGRREAFCGLFVYKPYDPGKGSYYGGVGDLEKEVCHN